MKIKLALSFLCLLLFVGCQKTNTTQTELLTVDVREGLKMNVSFSIKDDVEKIEYIPLETTDSCLIGNALSLAVSKEYLWAYNGKTDQILQFTRKGKFVREVGRSGNGPGEFNIVLDLCIDEKQKELFIFHYTGAPLVYSFEGEFLRSDSIPATNMFILSNRYRALKGLSMAPIQNAPWMAALVKADYQLTDSVFPYQSGWNKEVCFMKEILFSPSTPESVLSFTECNDTVFRIKSEGISPVLVLDRNNSTDYHQKVADIRQLQNDFKELSDITVSDLFESNRYYYLRYFKDAQPCVQRVSKADGSVLSFSIPETYQEASVRIPCQNVLGVTNDLDGGVPFWPEFYVDSRTRAQMVTYENIHKLVDLGCVKELPVALQRVGEYDNPVIILYTFRL